MWRVEFQWRFSSSKLTNLLFRCSLPTCQTSSFALFFFLTHTNTASPFLLHPAYMTSEFQRQRATAEVAKMVLYVGQKIATQTSNLIYKPYVPGRFGSDSKTHSNQSNRNPLKKNNKFKHL